MSLQVINVRPFVVAERTLRAIDKAQPFFDKASCLQRSKKLRVAIELVEVSSDRRRLTLARGGRRDQSVGKCAKIAERRRLIQLRANRVFDQSFVKFGVSSPFFKERETEKPSALVHRF